MNRKLAYELKVCLRTLRIPWLLAADFNMTPNEARECGLADIMGGLIVEPKGVEFTCTSGEGRMLDYWMMSEDARRFLINERTIGGVPWKPHYAIGIDVVAQPTAVVGAVANKGAPILSEANRKCTVNKLAKAENSDWEKAEQFAASGKNKFKEALAKRGPSHVPSATCLELPFDLQTGAGKSGAYKSL